MTGEAEPPRVRQPVPVTDDKTGFGGERFESRQYGRDLPEREQSGYVRERHPAHRGGLVHHRQRRGVEHHSGGGDHVPLVVVRHIDTGDQSGARGGARLVQHHPGA